MSAGLSEEQISVKNLIPYVILQATVQYDITIYLQEQLTLKLQELETQLTTSQSQHPRTNEQILSMYTIIFEKIKSNLAITKKKAKIQEQIKLDSLIKMNNSSNELNRENNRTRGIVKHLGGPEIYASAGSKFLWIQTLTAKISVLTRNIRELRVKLQERSRNIFKDFVMDDATRTLFCDFYVMECELRMLSNLVQIGTDKYKPFESVSVNVHKFFIFTRNGSLEEIESFPRLVASSGGGKRSKSKSKYHSRRITNKPKKQVKQKKINKIQNSTKTKKISRN